MKVHKRARLIRQKNAAWHALVKAERRCLAYQRSGATSEGYPTLPGGWYERREELRAAYEDVRRRYLKLALGRP